jgi:plasmid stability protein
MGQVLIRNVDDKVISALRTRAALRGFSLEAELRDVLTRAAAHPRADIARELAAVRAMTPGGPRRLSDELVREGRDER